MSFERPEMTLQSVPLSWSIIYHGTSGVFLKIRAEILQKLITGFSSQQDFLCLIHINKKRFKRNFICMFIVFGMYYCLKTEG